MSQLTEPQRQAITLAYYGGYSHSEVAERLEIPLGRQDSPSGREARAEVAALSDTAVRLAFATEPVTPSPQLKAGLMAAIRTTPQLSPSAAEPVEATEPAAAVELVETRPTSNAERKVRSRWFARPVTILVAAAAAVVLFAGGNLLGQATANPSAVQAQSRRRRRASSSCRRQLMCSRPTARCPVVTRSG